MISSSSASAREWLQQYEVFKKKVIATRGSGDVFSNQELKGLSSAISSLELQLRGMSSSPQQYDLAPSEIARRQVLIENLRKLMYGPLPQANVTLTTTSSSLGSSSSTIGSSSSSSSYNPVATSEKQLIQRQQDIMRIQDEMILDIGNGVSRLNQQAKAIGEEAKMHTRLLDDLDGTVELATAGLQAEAKHAATIKEQSRMCWMYICVIVEIIIILLLVVIIVAH